MFLTFYKTFMIPLINIYVNKIPKSSKIISSHDTENSIKLSDFYCNVTKNS